MKTLVCEKLEFADQFDEFCTFQKETWPTNRVLFANRKQDRFTLCIRYRIEGVTSKGKKWFNWRTGLTISATLRQPVSQNHPVLNLFFVGPLYGKRKRLPGVLNLTRNSSLLFSSIPQSLLPVFFDELRDLYLRNNQPYTTFKKDIKNVTIHDATIFIRNLAYPLYSNLLISQQEISPALYLTQLFRSSCIKDFCDFLKIESKSELRFFIEKHFINLDSNTLIILLTSAGVIDDCSRLKVIKQVLSSTPPHYPWGDTPKAILTLRQVLRKLSTQDVEKVLISLPEANFVQLGSALECWKENYKILRSVKTLFASKINITSDQLSAAIPIIVNEKKNALVDIPLSAILDKLTQFCDNTNLLIGTDKYSEGTFTVSIGGTSENLFVENESLFSWKDTNTKYSIRNIHRSKGMRSTSPIWKIIKANPYISITSFDSSKLVPLTSVAVSNLAYFTLLNDLTNMVDELLDEYKVNKTKTNISKTIAGLLFITAYDGGKGFKKFKGVLPRKFFTMLKNDINLEVALQALRNNLSVKNIVAMKDLPNSWIFKIIGYPTWSPTSPFQ